MRTSRSVRRLAIYKKWFAGTARVPPGCYASRPTASPARARVAFRTRLRSADELAIVTVGDLACPVVEPSSFRLRVRGHVPLQLGAAGARARRARPAVARGAGSRMNGRATKTTAATASTAAIASAMFIP